MKLISINIENNFHTQLVLQFLKRENAEVVCLQELLEEDFDFYKKELGFGGIYQATSYWKPNSHLTLVGKKQGVGIFAKNIISSGSIFYYGLEENIKRSFDDYMSRASFQKNYALVWANIENQGVNYKIITTHLPVTEKGAVTPFQMEVLDSFLKQTEKLGEFVLCGDTNAPRGREAFGRLADKYKDNIPPQYKTSIDQNLHRVRGIQFMVDCLFTTALYKALKVKLVDGISDHMAIVAEISIF